MKEMLRNIPILFAVVFTVTSSFGQTGAGGVGSNAQNAIWLDANAINQSSGTPVANITDVSGNGVVFSQSTSTKCPTFVTGIVNGLPAIQFDGSDDLLTTGSVASIESGNLTYYLVFQRATLTNQILITASYGSSATKWRTYCNSSSNNLISAQYSPTINHVSYSDPGAFTFTSTHITPTNISLYGQGALKMSKNVTYTTPTGHISLGLGNSINSTSNNYTLNGYIAEVIVYNIALNNLQRIIVENYLGAKYGMAVPSDFFAFEGTHNIGLVAIGNNGTHSRTIASGAGVMELSNPSDLGSNEYLMVAHTNIALTEFTTTDLPLSLPGYSRWTRTWRADQTGSVGTTDIKFDLSGGNDFGSSATYSLLVDDDGDFSNATIVTGSYNGADPSVTFNTDLADGAYFTLAASPEILEIHSIATGNWSDPGTWDCACIPSQLDQVYIDPFNAVTVDIDAETGYLSVEPNGTLIMSSAVSLDIYEDWDIIGTVSLTAGQIAFVGSADQYVDGGGSTIEFNDIVVNKTGALTFYTSQYILNGTLSPVAGSMVIDPAVGNQFIVNSTSASTSGRIGEIIAPFTFSGDFTVRRFIPAGNTDWRDVCSPVIGATFADWDPDLAMSGNNFPDGCAYGGGTCFHSVIYYESGTQFTVYNVTDEIQNGRGYEVYMGDDPNTFSGTTLSMTGPLNTSADIPLSFDGGWSTIGNPYASPILYSQVQRTSQISNYFYVYDASTGQYQYYDGSTGLGSIPEFDNGMISTGQAVWIFATSLGTITFQQNDKTAIGTFVKAATEREDRSLYIHLRENSSTYSGTLVLQELYQASDNADSLDMPHLALGTEAGPDFALNFKGQLIKKNFINADGRNKAFDIYMQLKNEGFYTISASNFEKFRDYRKIMLYDSQTGEMVDLKQEDYTFYGTISDDDRFTLVLTNDENGSESVINALTIGEDLSNDVTIIQMGHTFSVESTVSFADASEISLINVLGQKTEYYESMMLYEGSNLITVPDHLQGVHLLVIKSGDQIITKKVVL